MQTIQKQLGAEPQFLSLPPAVQKAILLHLTQQQQQQQETNQQGTDPQRPGAKDDNSAARGESHNAISTAQTT